LNVLARAQRNDTPLIGARNIKFERYRDRISRASQTPRRGSKGKEERNKQVDTIAESHVEKERTGSGLTNAKKKGMKRSEKRGDGRRVTRGRGAKCKILCMRCLFEEGG